MRPLLRRRNRTGIQLSGGAHDRVAGRGHGAVDLPVAASSRKNTGMNRSTVAIETLPCMATTAGMPASRQPRPERGQRAVVRGWARRRGGALARGEHDQPGRWRQAARRSTRSAGGHRRHLAVRAFEPEDRLARDPAPWQTR